MKLDNKTAVITGGASGLGEATMRHFLASGANCAIFDLDEDRAAALLDELGGDRLMVCQVDVTDEDSVNTALDSVAERFGGVHVCVNCAGLANPGKVLTREATATPLRDFEKVIRVNLVGTFNVMSKCAALMTRNTPEDDEERGVIINTASGAAYEGQIGQSAYASSKSGILGLNLPGARELVRYGIRVNAIAPGLFATPMALSLGDEVVEAITRTIESPKRLGRPGEFAHCCAFIVENAYLNGETIRLDAATRLAAR